MSVLRLNNSHLNFILLPSPKSAVVLTALASIAVMIPIASSTPPAIATPFVVQMQSSSIPVPVIWLAMQYFTIGISDDGNEPFRITSVRFIIIPDPTEEVELYEPQNFDILSASLSGGGGGVR